MGCLGLGRGHLEEEEGRWRSPEDEEETTGDMKRELTSRTRGRRFLSVSLLAFGVSVVREEDSIVGGIGRMIGGLENEYVRKERE